MKAAPRDKLITFQRPVTTKNELNEDVEGVPITLAQVFARVRFGSGRENRQAAQEVAQQAATFECLSNPTLATVQMTDRILFEDVRWNIHSRVPAGRDEIHFTATRKAD